MSRKIPDEVPIAPRPMPIAKCYRSGQRAMMVLPSTSTPRSSVPPPAKIKPPRQPPQTRTMEPKTAFNIKLIDLVKHRSCLYDPTSAASRSTYLRAQMWNGLAAMLDFEPGGLQLQKRWKQLRDKYVKERRRLSSLRQLSGQTAPFQQNCYWPLYNRMSFLDRFIVERDPDHVYPTNQAAKLTQRQRLVMSSKDMESFNKKLIECVRAHPLLYCVTDGLYRNQDERMRAWRHILERMDYPCDIYELQKSWKVLRDRYTRTRKKINEDNDMTENEKWLLYDDMRWLEPYLDQRYKLRENRVLARQAADRRRRGLIAQRDVEERDVVFDYEIDGEEMLADVFYDNELFELDGDIAFAVSCVAQIRTLPESVQELVRARVELALLRAPNAASSVLDDGDDQGLLGGGDEQTPVDGHSGDDDAVYIEEEIVEGPGDGQSVYMDNRPQAGHVMIKNRGEEDDDGELPENVLQEHVDENGSLGVL